MFYSFKWFNLPSRNGLSGKYSLQANKPNNISTSNFVHLQSLSSFINRNLLQVNLFLSHIHIYRISRFQSSRKQSSCSYLSGIFINNNLGAYKSRISFFIARKQVFSYSA